MDDYETINVSRNSPDYVINMIDKISKNNLIAIPIPERLMDKAIAYAKRYNLTHIIFVKTNETTIIYLDDNNGIKSREMHVEFSMWSSSDESKMFRINDNVDVDGMIFNYEYEEATKEKFDSLLDGMLENADISSCDNDYTLPKKRPDWDQDTLRYNILKLLKDVGRFSGPLTTVETLENLEAIRIAEREAGLPVDGIPDLELFTYLVDIHH